MTSGPEVFVFFRHIFVSCTDVCFICDWCESQIYEDESSSLKRKLSSYVSGFWNILDVTTLALFIIAVILRFIPSSVCADCFEVARTLLALNLMTFLTRLLQFFSVNKVLGPKLVMIGRMVSEVNVIMRAILLMLISWLGFIK